MSNKENTPNTKTEGNKLIIALANFCDPINTPISFGPKFIKFNYIINAQKTGTIIIMSLLMYIYNNYSKGAWLYLSLHGTYGIIWFLKDMVFPDKSFQQLLTIPSAILVWVLLFLYWIMGFEMMMGKGDQDPSPKKIFGCFFIYTFGVVLMLGTDLQKFIVLKYKKGLIDDLFLAKNRNTNYLGEILIYLTFAIATGTIFGYVMLSCVWVFVFGSRMYMKDLSLAKKHGFEKYKQNSYLILFKFFDNDILNVGLYLLIIVGVVLFIKF